VRVVYSSQALTDLLLIEQYFATRNPEAGKRILLEIEKIKDQLREFPESGTKQNLVGVRRLVGLRYGYLIYYRQREDRIEISTIRHGRQERIFED
jgi:toxin ParE1/3/4